MKRLNYFKNQFLKVKDFQDEQQYHIDKLRFHNKYLHARGIASGLDVTFTPGEKYVTISAGMSIDAAGHEIILAVDSQFDFSEFEVASYYLTISYDDVESDPNTKYSRTTEVPKFECNKEMPENSSMQIVIAKVETMSGQGGVVVKSVDTSFRKPPETKADDTGDNEKTEDSDVDHHRGDLELGSDDNNKVTVYGTINSAHSSGALQVKSPLNVKGALTIEGNVGIGVKGPTSKLSVAGIIESTAIGFKFPDGTIQTTAAKGGDSSLSNTSNLDVADRLKVYSSKEPDNFLAIIADRTLGPKYEGRGNDIVLRSSNKKGINIASEDKLSLSTFERSWKRRLTILNNGNVGIGSTDPQSLLHLIRPMSPAIILEESSAPTGQKVMRLHFGNNGLQFQDMNDSYSYVKELVTIRKTGEVGIGTINPKGNLDVNGTIFQRGKELYADYVFESDYNLESIDEHADYMWKNKRLKAVPKTTKDEQGQEIIEVGEHQKGIVEELEKAHIYIQQLHERVKTLEEKFISRKERKGNGQV